MHEKGTPVLTTQTSPVTPTDPVEAGLREGWQLPARLYSDPAVFELEKELIFRKAWQFVATLDQLRDPGSYVTADLGDVPVVVVRTKDGALIGHVNACLHRLHPVAKGAGCKQLFQCAYHGWTYNLDGALRTVPRSKGEPGFDKSGMQLASVRVEAYGNFVFANADPDATPLADYIGEAAGAIPALNIDFSTWERASTFTYEVEANWKLFMENSLECYHCDLVHGDTFGEAFNTDPENYICENYANVLTQVAPIDHAPATETRPVDELDKFRLLYVWPSTAVSIDEYAGTITRLVPNGPKKCTFHVDVFARPRVDQATIDSWMEMYDTTFKQDKVVVMAQQAGYDSGRIERGRLLPGNESSIAMFQQRTWKALKPAFEGEEA